jgi:hypothetical protein
MTPLEPDRDQIEIFVDALFRYASKDGFVSSRAFYDGADERPFRIQGVPLSGGLRYLIDVTEDDARRAAQCPKPVVFCPPVAVFANKNRATEKDLAQGIALSVELDAQPEKAITRLASLLGPPTVLVRSGGIWADPDTGEKQDKLHAYWRLASPAQGGGLDGLKQARKLAAAVAGGDPTNVPAVHPIRWPGSWHRKAEPRLCRIVEANPDCEIDLDAALAALTQAAPNTVSRTAQLNGQTTSYVDAGGEPREWHENIRIVTNGDDGMHYSLVSFAMKLLRSGMHDGATVNLLRGMLEGSTAPRDERWQRRYREIVPAVSSARGKLGPETILAEQPEPCAFEILQYKCPPENSIPARPWVGWKHYLRRAVSATVAAPGRAKTSKDLLDAVSMAVGKDLLTGQEIPRRRVLHLNAEEDQAELDLRVAAIRRRYGLKDSDYDGWLFVQSVIGQPLKFAFKDRTGAAQPNVALVRNVIEQVKALAIDVVQFDPLISFHKVSENHNEDMDTLVKEAFAVIAKECDAAVEICHHVRKSAPGQESSTVDDARGGGALIGAVRIARTLNFMTSTEAEKLAIEDDRRRSYVRVDDGKGNPKPLGKAVWVEITPETLDNGEQVATLQTWSPPAPMSDVTVDHMHQVRSLVRTGDYRCDSRSPDWLGWKLAKILDLPLEYGRRNEKHHMIKVNSVLKIWEKNNVLARQQRLDKSRVSRDWFIPGSFGEGDTEADNRAAQLMQD